MTMSTRGTIHHDGAGEHWTHLFIECFDEGPGESIHVEQRRLDVSSSTLDFPAQLAVYRYVADAIGQALKVADETDAQIEARVLADVAERVKAFADSRDDPKGSAGHFAAFLGMGTYGAPSDPKDEQVARGVAALKSRRRRCEEFVEKYGLREPRAKAATR